MYGLMKEFYLRGSVGFLPLMAVTSPGGVFSFFQKATNNGSS